MINIAICDDTKECVDDLKNKIISCNACNDVEINIFTFYNLEDISNEIDNLKFNIIFLDIRWEQEKITSLSIADKIKNKLPDCLLIYVSFYNCYYQELVNHEPFRFISKPINERDLEEVLLSAYSRIISSEAYYSFTYNRVMQIIRIRDIKYIYSEHRKLVIVMHDNKKYTFYKKLDDFEKEIKEKYKYFIRIGKSYLINYLQAATIASDHVEYKDGEKMFYSKKYAKKVIEKIYEFQMSNCT